MNRGQEPGPASLNLTYDLAREFLRVQLQQVESADEKLRLVFGSSSVIVGIGAAFLVNRGDELPVISLLAYVGGAGAYFTIIVIAVRAYSFFSLQFPPNVISVWENALFWPEPVTKRQVLATMIQAIEINERLIADKSRWTQIGLYLIPIQVTFLLTGTGFAYFLG